MAPIHFDRREAFSRSLGWLTEAELELLGTKTVAIAGVGGVGGHYCEVLARLGIQKFHLADPDIFELVNFNRQNASGVSTLKRKKLDVLSERIRDINPNAEITAFPQGVTVENLDEFLNGVDLYLDGLDFFVLNERFHVFDKLHEKKIPSLTVAPIGMGASLVVFTNDSMSFAEYFGISPGLDPLENSLRFLTGVAPSLMHAKYQVDRSRVDFKARRVPSLPMGCYLCAGVAGSTALKLLLKRGPIKGAPHVYHYDAYLQKLRKSYTWGGYRNPLMRLKRFIVRKIVQAS